MSTAPTTPTAPDLAPDLDADLGTRVELLKAVADPTRLQVLELLAHLGPRCHCELEQQLGVAASRLSFHLRVLRERGLVTTRRDGRLVLYHLAPDGLAAVHDALPQLRPATERATGTRRPTVPTHEVAR